MTGNIQCAYEIVTEVANEKQNLFFELNPIIGKLQEFMEDEFEGRGWFDLIDSIPQNEQNKNILGEVRHDNIQSAYMLFFWTLSINFYSFYLILNVNYFVVCVLFV